MCMSHNLQNRIAHAEPIGGKVEDHGKSDVARIYLRSVVSLLHISRNFTIHKSKQLNILQRSFEALALKYGCVNTRRSPQLRKH